MQINMVKFGSGVPAIFKGSPIKVPPVSGKLRIMGGNIQKSSGGTKKVVQHANQKLEKFATSPKGSGVNIKA